VVKPYSLLEKTMTWQQEQFTKSISSSSLCKLSFPNLLPYTNKTCSASWNAQTRSFIVDLCHKYWWRPRRVLVKGSKSQKNKRVPSCRIWTFALSLQDDAEEARTEDWEKGTRCGLCSKLSNWRDSSWTGHWVVCEMLYGTV
jgi:hypothetical protein